jgi:ABC-type nitrate/sulfonate/bicarbonate transport system substrate-binding protein
MKLMKVFLVLVTLGAGLLAYENITNSSIISKPTVTIAVSKTPLSAPFYIAESQGFFKESCVNVEINDVIGGNNSFDQVIKGNADFGTSSASVIVFQGMYRSDFVTLASFSQSDNDVKIISHEKANIVNSIDIKGKRIGLTKGASGEYLLSNYLALSGLTSDQVEVVSFSPDKLPQALLEQQVDVIVPWEPYAYEIIQKLNTEVKTFDTKNLNTLMFNLVSRPLDSKEKLEQSACVLQALNDAINYISINPKKARQIIAKRINASLQFIDWVWPDYIFKLSLNRSLLMNFKSQAIWMIDSGLVGRSKLPDYKLLLDERALQKVNPMGVRL